MAGYLVMKHLPLTIVGPVNASRSVLVLVGARLDVTLGTTFVKDGVCAAFILNETLSVTENVGAMGVPIPAPVRRAVELLRSKGEGSGGDK